MSKYHPKVNDYVKWKSLCGWVYFVDNEYITIETVVYPKHPEDLDYGTYHRNERVLVLCYSEQWKELEYVRSRSSVYDKT